MAAPYTCSASDVLASVQTDVDRGLTSEEARRRLQSYGPNRIMEAPPRPWWLSFLGQFNELVVWILIGAAILSGAFGDWTDTIAILAIVLMNGTLGFIQEGRAERALDALKRLSNPSSHVIRDGQLALIPSDELVPGDIVHLEAGDFVPADGRLLTTSALSIQESTLTGESVAVQKQANVSLPDDTPLGDRQNMAYLATTVAAGRGVLLITSTGMSTELGRIATMLTRSGPEPTPLQRRMDALGKILLVACLSIVAVIFILQLLRGARLMEVLLLSISLAVAAVPEGLPAVITVALALGLQRMVRRKALVRRLPSVETLGSVTVICTDKTGTLTRNEMTVRELLIGDVHYEVTGVGYIAKGEFHPTELKPPHPSTSQQKNSDQLAWLLTIGARCNNAQAIPRGSANEPWQIIGDPTEGALIIAALKHGIDVTGTDLLTLYEVPFSSDRKMMSMAVKRSDGTHWLFVKGAPEIILERCVAERRNEEIAPLSSDRRRFWSEQNQNMASRALRVLALAYRQDPGLVDDGDQEVDLTFCGLVGMIDPPREEVAAAVTLCREAGIRPIMITGDHPETALAIARELTISDADAPEVLAGPQIENMSQEELERRVERISVYARATAEHKLRVVQAWKHRGQIVAMTGDGVNDAPAIKAADIGISMGLTGTDVTKTASDMVLMDDNFASIVHAVEEGRGIFDNIQKIVHFLLSCNVGEVIFMFSAALLGLPAPLQPIHLLWINLITDGLPALALAMEPPEPNIMRRPPRPTNQSVITFAGGRRILLHGLLIAASTLLAFIIAYQWNPENLRLAQFTAFCAMAYTQLAYSLACRSQTYTWPELGFLTNPVLFLTVLISALLQLSVQTISMSYPLLGVTGHSTFEFGIILGASLFPVTVIELSKLFRAWTTSR